MFTGLFTINLLFYTTNFVGCLFFFGPGAESGPKKITRYTFIFPCQQFYFCCLWLFKEGCILDNHSFRSSHSRWILVGVQRGNTFSTMLNTYQPQSTVWHSPDVPLQQPDAKLSAWYLVHADQERFFCQTGPIAGHLHAPHELWRTVCISDPWQMMKLVCIHCNVCIVYTGKLIY